MRKIEEQMIEAIRQRKGMIAGNTAVTVHADGTISVYLHGNGIAFTTPDGTIKPNIATFKRWPTRTTVSRLRALGINASVRKGKACIDGREI